METKDIIEGLVQHYGEYMNEKFPQSYDMLYPSNSIKYFLEEYLLSKELKEVGFFQNLDREGYGKLETELNLLVEKIVKSSRWNYDKLATVVKRNYNYELKDFIFQKLRWEMSEADIQELLISEKFRDFYEEKYKMNSLESIIGYKGSDYSFSPINILFMYIHEKHMNTSGYSDKEFIHAYKEDIKEYKEWLDRNTEYDKDSFNHLITNPELINYMKEIYTNTNKDEIKMYAQMYLEQVLQHNEIIYHSKLSDSDKDTVFAELHKHLIKYDFGAVTINEFYRYFAENYSKFDKVYYLSEDMERDEYLANKVEEMMSEVVENITAFSENGFFEGEKNEQGFVTMPTVPTKESLLEIVQQVEQANSCFINSRNIFNQKLYPDLYRLLNRESIDVLESIKVFQLFEVAMQENLHTLDSLLEYLDMEVMFNDYAEQVDNMFLEYPSFVEWLENDSVRDQLTSAYRDVIYHSSKSNAVKYSSYEVAMFILEQYDNMTESHINYDDSPIVQGALQGVFTWCSTMGISLDREMFSKYIQVTAEVKRRIGDVLTKHTDESRQYEYMLALFDNYVPMFTYGKRYTVRDRGFIVDSIDVMKKKYDVTKSTTEILKILMKEKETLEFKTNRREMPDYLEKLDEYIGKFVLEFRRPEPPQDVPYVELDIDSQHAIKEDMIDSKELHGQLPKDDVNSWVEYHIKNFIAREQQQMIYYDLNDKDFIKLLELGELSFLKEKFEKDRESEDTDLSMELDVMHSYIKNKAKQFQVEPSLTSSDIQLFEAEIQKLTHQMNKKNKWFTPKIDGRAVYNQIGEEKLLELKLNSSNEKEFMDKIRGELVELLEDNRRYDEEFMKSSFFDPNSPEFTMENKLSRLENNMVRVVLHTNSGRNTRVITRNMEYLNLYLDFDHQIIQQQIPTIEEYTEYYDLTTKGNEVYVVDVGEGELVKVDLDKIISFDTSFDVSGWIAYEFDNDVWYTVALHGDSPTKFYDSGEELTKSKPKFNNRERQEYEIQRKRDLIILRNDLESKRKIDEELEREHQEKVNEELAKAMEEEYQAQKEEQEQEEDIEDKIDSGERSLKDNINNSMETIQSLEEFYIEEMDEYRELVFKKLVKTVLEWKTLGIKHSDLKALNIDRDGHTIQFFVGVNKYIVTPFYVVNLSYSYVHVDILGKVRDELGEQGDIPIIEKQEDINYLKNIAKIITAKRSLSPKDFFKNSKEDMERLIRLKKLLNIQKKHFMDNQLRIVDNINGTPDSHIEIHTYRVSRKNKSNKPQPVTYIFAPSIMYVKDTGEVIFKREGDGINLKELYQILHESQIGGQVNKKKLFSLFKILDKRRSL